MSNRKIKNDEKSLNEIEPPCDQENNAVENDQVEEKEHIDDNYPIEPLDVSEFKNDEELCDHSDIIEDKGIEVCQLCGIELYQKMNYELETRYYGSGDSRFGADPSRCSLRKIEDKSIFKDIDGFGIPTTIGEEANRMYHHVTQGNIRRGNFRKAIIYGCVHNAYKNQPGMPKVPDQIKEKFVLSKKKISNGLIFVNVNMDKKNKTKYLSPANFIPDITEKFKASEKHVAQIEKLFKRIENRSRTINSSNPKSVICGLVYYYCRLIGKEITCSKFSKIVRLSDITISKIAEEISVLFGTTDTVKLK